MIFWSEFCDENEIEIQIFITFDKCKQATVFENYSLGKIVLLVSMCSYVRGRHATQCMGVIAPLIATIILKQDNDYLSSLSLLVTV